MGTLFNIAFFILLVLGGILYIRLVKRQRDLLNHNTFIEEERRVLGKKNSVLELEIIDLEHSVKMLEVANKKDNSSVEDVKEANNKIEELNRTIVKLNKHTAAQKVSIQDLKKELCTTKAQLLQQSVVDPVLKTKQDSLLDAVKSVVYKDKAGDTMAKVLETVDVLVLLALMDKHPEIKSESDLYGENPQGIKEIKEPYGEKYMELFELYSQVLTNNFLDVE